jgi:hypothetical protein
MQLFLNFPLYFRLDRSDESSCADNKPQPTRRNSTMTNEAATTENLINKAAVAAGVIPAPEQGASKTKKATKKASKPAAKKTPKSKDVTATPREGSKKQIVLDLLRRKDGATLEEIMKETGWLAHSVRGFISGSLTRKMGLSIESSKTERGRMYRLATK